MVNNPDRAGERANRLNYERRVLHAEVEGVKAERAMREAAAHVATSFLVGDPANGIPLRNPMAHEIADAIRKLPLTLGSNDTRTASGMSAGTAETPQEAQGEARQPGAGTADAQPTPGDSNG